MGVKLWQFVKIFVFLSLIANISLAKPKDYDSCILENIGNAKTNSAVRIILESCRNLFKIPAFDPTKPSTAVGEVEKETDDSTEAQNPFLNLTRKKFFLTGLQKGRTGDFVNLEIINDTNHLIEDVYITYKEKSCEMPTNAAVAQAQKILNREGYSAGKVDGKFGVNTLKAVKLFQKKMDLTVTGRIDDQTLEVLGIDTEIGWLTQGPAQQKLWIAPGASQRYKFYLPNLTICFQTVGYANIKK